MKALEEWRDVPGYEGLYQVSNFGKVRSVDRTVTDSIGRSRFINGQILKHYPDRKGYRYTWLCKSGVSKQQKIHRIVANAFIPNPLHLPEVNHIDHNVSNNIVDNLEWCTKEYNLSNRRHIGRHCKIV